LHVLKKRCKDYKPKQFAFMIKALDELGFINFNENKEIFAAFEYYFGYTCGSTSSKNKGLVMAGSDIKYELLPRMKSEIVTIIANYKPENEFK